MHIKCIYIYSLWLETLKLMHKVSMKVFLHFVNWNCHTTNDKKNVVRRNWSWGIFKHMVVDEYYWDQNTINLFRHVHPFSRIPILPVYKLQANGVFFLTMLLCQIFSNVFSQWHMYGIGVVLLVALNDLVGSEAPTILRNFLQRFKSTKEE